MLRISATIALAFIVVLCAQTVAAERTSPADYSVGDSVPLGEDDLEAITLQALEQHPMLSSSPGIKYASAQRSVRSTDIADARLAEGGDPVNPEDWQASIFVPERPGK